MFWLLALAGPAALGVSPALLPSGLPSWVRWSFAVLLLAASIWFYQAASYPHPYHIVFLVPFWIGWMLGVIIMMPWPARERTALN